MASISAENIVFGGEVTSSVTCNYKSLGHFILDKLESYNDLILVIDASTGAEYSAKALKNQIIRLASCLKQLHIKTGDVISISSENCFEFAVALLAGICLNVTVAPFNVTYTERELEHAMNLAKPKVFFCSDTVVDRVAKVGQSKKFLKNIITFGQKAQSSKIIRYYELLQRTKDTVPLEFDPPIASKQNDVALIVCSSGTTGMPKGVQLTQNNILTTLDAQFDPSSGIQISDLTLLTVIPWFHAFGCLTLITSCVMGATLVYLKKFEESTFLNAIQKYKIVVAFMVPPLMVFLRKHPLVDKYDLSSLQALLCGAAPLSKETVDGIQKRIGIPIVRQGYGLSEATLSLLVQSNELCKPGSVGALKKGIYCKVIDPETGKHLGPMERGELCFKGDCIMKGYIGDTRSTQNAIKDGWLHTGDIGYFDKDFEFFIVDRIKELIKYKGYQVPPAEIEGLLLTHQKIKDVAVIGKPDEASGELPMAFVVKQPNVELTADEVIKFVEERASPAKKLRGGVIFIDEIPKNPSGKILRRILRDILKKNIKSKL